MFNVVADVADFQTSYAIHTYIHLFILQLPSGAVASTLNPLTV
jgi:hypothetical protein